MRVLVIEDDARVREFVVQGLREHGHAVDVACEGREGLLLASSRDFDVLVVDRMLPGLEGVALIKTLRVTGNTTPVLILSALGEVHQRVEGLKGGADDYLAKPFAFSELIARLEALQRRRTQSPAVTELSLAELSMDLLARRVTRAERVIELQPREFKLLECLLRHAGQVVTRTMLLEQVWEYHFDPQTNVIDVHISRLRQKIDRGFESPMIHTVRGIGYVLQSG